MTTPKKGLRPTLLYQALLAAFICAPCIAPAQTSGAPARNSFEPVLPVPLDGSMTNLPDDFARGADTGRDQVHRVQIEVDRDLVPADGQTAVNVTVRLFGADDKPLVKDMRVTVESSGGRIRLPDAANDADGAQKRALDRVMPGVQLTVTHGVAQFALIAPAVPKDVVLKVTAGSEQAGGAVHFVPELREMIATGLVEGIISAQQKSVPGVSNDQLENELTHFQKTLDDGKDGLGARAEFFLKGVVSGQYLLTMAYDSDRASLSPLFRDIRPEEFYPVYGDASVKGFDAQTTQKLYVRIDQDHSFLMYGDFNTTGALQNPSALGNYSRSLTGVDGHLENTHEVVEAYASHGASQQVIDEQPSRGTSGPYYVSNLNGIRNSEKVEILTRDRNQPAVILNDQLMTRYIDYTFDPFAGQVLFVSPVPTVDANFNPITVRITYEVDAGGPNYYVFGGQAQVKIGENAMVGGTYAEDQNPLDRYRLESVNGTVRLDANTSVSGEFAHSALNQGQDPILSSPYSPVESGSGMRVNLRHSDGPWEMSIDAGRTDIGFYNPSATLQGGREEIAARTSYLIDPQWKVSGELLESQDRTSGAERTGGQVFADYKLNDIFTLEAGLRRSNDKVGQIDGQPVAVNAYAAGVTNTPIGQSYTPYQANSPQLQNAPALTDSTSLRLRLTAQLSPKSSVFGEYERDVVDADKQRYAVGVDYQIADLTRLYARHEWSSSSSGPYGLDVAGGRDTMTTVGIDQTYMKDGQVFSEYRLRDSEDERDAVASFGVRNLWNIADGVRVNTSFERQNVLFNSSTAEAGTVSALPQTQLTTNPAQPAAGNPLSAAGGGLGSVGSLPTATPLSVPYTTGAATVLTGALELTYDPLWKAAARLELRQDPDYNSVLSTLAYSAKVNRDVTFIARNFLNYLAARNDTVADEYDDRLQFGVAFRPVDDNRFNGLARYELRLAENLSAPDPAKEWAHIFSTVGTYHPSRPWWFTARVAAEQVNDDFSGVHSHYFAYLVGGRVMYDITKRWDIGFTENILFSPEGAARQYALGLEVGYLVKANLWLSTGYNWVGFSNKDLTGTDYTNRGVYLRLRYKFDEDLFAGDTPGLNPAPEPETAVHGGNSSFVPVTPVPLASPASAAGTAPGSPAPAAAAGSTTSFDHPL